MTTTNWANTIKDLDGHKCVMCGSDDRIEAHHLSRAWQSKVDNVLDNGITLCQRCHYCIHGGQMNDWDAIQFNPRAKRMIAFARDYIASGRTIKPYSEILEQSEQEYRIFRREYEEHKAKRKAVKAAEREEYYSVIDKAALLHNESRTEYISKAVKARLFLDGVVLDTIGEQ